MPLLRGCDPVIERVRPRGIDLLAFGPMRRLVLWAGLPYVFQLLTLCVLLSLAVIGWGQMTPKGVPDKLYAKANLVNLVVWGLFWPMIVWATVLLGRVWCTICPLELVSNVFERVGRRLGIAQRSIPGWMRAGWLMVILYALLQLLVAGLHLHRVPGYTSVFLWGMVATAAATGVLLRDRAYCRGFCPVAPLLRVYGRGGMIAVRAAGPSSWIEGVWTIGVFPLFLWSAIAGILLLFKGASSFGEAVRRLALPLAVIMAAGQMAKGLAKFVSWAGFLPLAWKQPDGVSTSLAMAARTMKQPASLLSLRAVSVIGVALVLTALWFSFRELRLVNGTLQAIWRIPVIATAGTYGVVIFGWGFLQ